MGRFLIDSFNMPGNGLDDVAFDWAFISFTHGLTAAPPIVGSTVPLAGDYNGDGKVDQQDYDVWRSSLECRGPHWQQMEIMTVWWTKAIT